MDMKRPADPFLLSIAGYDPSAGAGVLLDIWVFRRLSFRGLGVLTAVTAQNPGRVEGLLPLPARFLLRQFRALQNGAEWAGIKVGMVGSAENLRAAARILGENGRVPRVIDPVFRSSSGTALLERRAWPRFLETVRGKASLITPNMAEASILAGFPVRTAGDMRKAARRIAGQGDMACLVKGGHLDKEKVCEVLDDGRDVTVFDHPRLRKNVHGTGCYLSAAVLGYLAGGHGLQEACLLAIAMTARAIRRAKPAAGPSGRNVCSFSTD